MVDEIGGLFANGLSDVLGDEPKQTWLAVRIGVLDENDPCGQPLASRLAEREFI